VSADELIDLSPLQRLRMITLTPPQRTIELFRTMGDQPALPMKVLALWRFRREFRLGTPRAAVLT
jgi:hypothetical protein